MIDAHAPHADLPMCDAFSMSSGATNAFDHCFFDAQTDGLNTSCAIYGYADPLFKIPMWSCTADVGAGFLDPGQLHAQSITGVAPDPVTDAIWTLEDSLYPYATKWLVDTSGNTISYADVFFGTGSNTDSDDGLQNGLDITIGKSNHMYVLDSTSSLGYRIKAFDNVTGQPIGSSVQVSMPVDPLRIDGCIDLGLVAVMGRGSSSWYVNLYDPQELP